MVWNEWRREDGGAGSQGGWARTSGVDPDEFVVGDNGSQQLVITFEVLPVSTGRHPGLPSRRLP